MSLRIRFSFPRKASIDTSLSIYDTTGKLGVWAEDEDSLLSDVKELLCQ